MNKISLFLSSLLLQGAMLSCSNSGADEPEFTERQRFSLELSVTAGNAEVGNDTETKERKINSIYVYAFDDLFPTAPNFMKDLSVKDGQSGIYHLKMEIRNKVKKRFYFFVNPPASIRKELIPNCPEERLKSLTIDQKSPLMETGNMPMSNYFEAYVDGYSTDHHNGDQSDEVFLYPEAPGTTEKNHKISEIPVFRSLGKITVQAYLKGGYVPVENDEKITEKSLSISKLEIFNFNTDGSALPLWTSNGNTTNFWVQQQQDANYYYIWNKNLNLDLLKMSVKEVMVENKTANIQIKRTTPVSSTDRDNPDYITHYYLCQNSFGERISESEQEGVKDEVGNRITKMIVTLNDGRVGEVSLPYLRRNDNLRIRLAINEFKIDAEFEVWKESIVTPDWNEEISPNPIN